MKILLAGDTHADYDNLCSLIDKASSNECSQIFVLGDLGYFPNHPGNSFMFHTISQHLSQHDIRLNWLPGNHENWESISNFPKDGFHEIYENIFFSPTGNVFEINGTTFMTVGGAYSIDKAYRTRGVDWFPEEELTYADYELCSSKGNVDILLTHDCPESIHIPNLLPIPEAIPNRTLLDHIFREVKPKKLFHGHYHRWLESKIEIDDFSCDVVGLDCNLRFSKQTYILNLGG